MSIPIKRLPSGEGLPLPRYASPGAAGLDLHAAIDDVMNIHPGTTSAVPTGISIALPEGYEGQVRPRSGLAINHNVGIINAPGTIDTDYRGEVMVLLTNFSDRDYTIKRGDRIAQLVVARYEKIEWMVVRQLPPSSRGSDGFGHSGK